MNRDNLLMVADTEHCADMLYAVGMFAPDPFIYLRLRGRAHLVVSDLEIDRAREQAGHCRVLSLSRLQQRLRKDGVKRPGLPHVIRRVLKDHKIKGVSVPAQFPLGLARELARLNLRVKPAKDAVFPERQFKTTEEVKKISAALIMAEVGLAEAIQALKACKIDRRHRLIHRGNPLTSEKLRAIIDTAVLQAGGQATRTIVAGGRQACDPHECGHGVLRAHEPIVLDVFPRSQKTGYFGDITRTVVRGRASEGLRRLYHTVAQAQQFGFQQLRHGVRSGDVHEQVDQFFRRQGYKTGRRGGRMQGFFHGTGHGVGLELHESPRLGLHSRDTLKAGHVVTVEPGLYYWELGGGVRLEDIALVTRNGARNLTQFEKAFEV